ncbi:b5 reductase 1 [Seminavis robusta]|uniref:B5 reductase 1 n=1 Tax=Seminavis robusta TaxID=568900 RepID=A0A9N8EKW7_9STRA|nr:b5 reductase 1 [Seminavis robusta]|eukprot:Sro1168_g248500.1 b5 reductase 1 (279) ;mRNA; r:20527-21363
MTQTKLIKKTTLVSAAATRLPVHTLTFAIPRFDPSVHRGKSHSEVAIDKGDVVKMVIPGYKPKSYSMSALREQEFDVTFKVYPNGRASGFLDSMKVGDELESFGKSSGRHHNPGSFVGIVSYGVGITEGLPVTKAELEKGDAEKVVLLWASRTMGDTFWHEEIKALQNEYPGRFEMVHILSREEHQGCFHGHITPKLLDQAFQPADRGQARFLSVGTKDMMRITNRMLEEIGYPMPEHALLPKSRSSHHQRHGKHHSRTSCKDRKHHKGRECDKKHRR